MVGQSARAAAAAPADIPLGVLEDSDYEQFAVRLRPGDLVVVYTDSLVETVTPEGVQIGERGLLEVAAGLDVSRPERLARGVYEAVRERCGREPADDVTAMVIRPNGLLPRVTFREKLAAQWRFVKLLLGSWRRGAAPVPWPDARIENVLAAVVPAAGKRYRAGDPEL